MGVGVGFKTWIGNKPGSREAPKPAPFVGFGTVLISDVANVSYAAAHTHLLDFIELMKRQNDAVFKIVHAHGGTVSQHVGDACMAYWRDTDGTGSHARRAFAAAQEMVMSPPVLWGIPADVTLSLRVVLGTGEIAGDYFGPVKHFQIVGAADAIAERLSRHGGFAPATIRLSQHTRDLLGDITGLHDTGAITRVPMPDLQIFEWRATAKRESYPDFVQPE